ncbi:MAG: PLDc N-terminal domain-containing protein [Nanoarchaeota archaeon]
MAGELIISFFGLIFILAIVAFIFWVLMLIDAIKRNFKGDNDKLLWILVIIFAGVIGAIIYYFMVKKKGK